MDDCGRMNHAMLQWLTNSLTPWTIDSAVGDMKLDSEAGPQLATYARYNVLLDQRWLADAVEADYAPDRLTRIAQMDDPSNMKELAETGGPAARRQVKPEHFPAVFDVS